ncbi:hypothetical protein ACRRTK_012428 [Alexandromys fortis]
MCKSLEKQLCNVPPVTYRQYFLQNVTTVSTFHRFNFLKPKWLALLFKDFLKLELPLSGAAFAWHAEDPGLKLRHLQRMTRTVCKMVRSTN